MERETMPNEKERSDKTITTLIYVLYALSLFFGITGVAAIVMNYVKRADVAGTWLESHFKWQIRTFWYSVLWAAVGFLLTFVVVGFAVLFLDTVWFIYRVVKGWVNLSADKPMYEVNARESSE